VVKNLGKGVGVASGVLVGAGVSVKGIDVGRAVSVGKSGATAVEVVDRSPDGDAQAVTRRMHPRRKNFFMSFL
jgi:hypothetical protein